MKEIVDISNAKLDKTLGYYYLIVKGHPLADKYGKFYLHRYVASIKEGRWLNSEDQVDHINSIKTDNRPENLQILSRSEHSKKTAKDLGFELKEYKDYICGFCRNSFSSYEKDSRYCSRDCCSLAKRKFEITKEELSLLVWKYPTTQIAKMFNVSDVAIAKRCKLLGVDKPSRGYWAKFCRDSQIKQTGEAL